MVPSCSIGSDERIVREAFNSDADVRTSVLVSVLKNAEARPTTVTREGARASAEAPSAHLWHTPEVWLHECSEAAGRELGALAASTEPLRLRATLLRRISAAPLHVGACLEENEDGGELCGHLVRFARCDQFSAASSASSATTVDDEGGFYVVFRNDKDELDVFGLVPLQWHALPPHALPPPAQSSIAKKDVAKKHNFFACLGDEDTPTIDEVVEVLDLHGRTVAEAIEEVEALLARYTGSARGLLHLVVGAGKHSVDGIAAIKPAVRLLLHKCGVAHGTLHNNPGTLWVNVETIRPASFADESVTVVEDYGYIGDILHLLTNVQRQLRRGTWPRITDALAAPQQRSLLPATLFKGRCAFGDVQLPSAPHGECDVHQLAAIHRCWVCVCVCVCWCAVLYLQSPAVMPTHVSLSALVPARVSLSACRAACRPSLERDRDDLERDSY